MPPSEAVQLRRVVDQDAPSRRVVVGPIQQQVEHRAACPGRYRVRDAASCSPRRSAPGAAATSARASDRDVGVVRRPGLRRLVGRGQLDPGVAAVEQSEQAPEIPDALVATGSRNLPLWSMTSGTGSRASASS